MYVLVIKCLRLCYRPQVRLHNLTTDIMGYALLGEIPAWPSRVGMPVAGVCVCLKFVRIK